MKRPSQIILIVFSCIVSLMLAGCHGADMKDVTADDVAGWFGIGEGPPEGEPIVQGEEDGGEGEAEVEEEEAVPPEGEAAPLPYSLQHLKIMKVDSSVMNLTDKPIPLKIAIKASFSRPLAEEERSLFEADFLLKSSTTGEAFPGTFVWNADKDEVIFAPKRKLRYDTVYSLHAAGADHSFTTMTKGDINGDGFADLMIGEPGWSSGKGRVMVVGGAALPTVLSVIKEGENPGDNFGAAVSMAGDINADGYEDIVIGAPSFDNGSLVDAGKAYIYFGPTLSAVAAVILGEDANSSVGSSVAGCDPNGDGFMDVLAGAPRFNSLKGRVYVLKGGPAPATIFKVEAPTAPPTQQFGHSIACLGSHDAALVGDDVLIGSPLFETNRGRISIHRGETLAQLTFKVGDDPGDRFGWTVATIADLNGDKRRDILVGAPFRDSERGMAYVFIAKDDLTLASAIAKGQGEAANNHYGEALMAIPDITGDGKEDLLIGAPRHNTTQGKIYAVKSSESDLPTIVSRQGDAPDAGLGNAVALVRDLDGDNRDDIVVGESGFNGSRGKALILGSVNVTTPALAEITGADTGNRLGSSLAGR